jgi:hypothetical protein
MARDVMDGDDVSASTTQFARHALPLFHAACLGPPYRFAPVYRTAHSAWQFPTRDRRFASENPFLREKRRRRGMRGKKLDNPCRRRRYDRRGAAFCASGIKVIKYKKARTRTF